MIVSMTGYAAVAAELPGVSLSVELRSVNHRYLDLQLRLPDELRGLVIETSFGYAFGLELDAELVFLHLHATLDGLIASADRVEAALLALGWRVIPDTPPSLTHTKLWRSSCRCDPCC